MCVPNTAVSSQKLCGVIDEAAFWKEPRIRVLSCKLPPPRTTRVVRVRRAGCACYQVTARLTRSRWFFYDTGLADIFFRKSEAPVGQRHALPAFPHRSADLEAPAKSERFSPPQRGRTLVVVAMASSGDVTCFTSPVKWVSSLSPVCPRASQSFEKSFKCNKENNYEYKNTSDVTNWGKINSTGLNIDGKVKFRCFF